MTLSIRGQATNDRRIRLISPKSFTECVVFEYDGQTARCETAEYTEELKRAYSNLPSSLDQAIRLMGTVPYRIAIPAMVKMGLADPTETCYKVKIVMRSGEVHYRVCPSRFGAIRLMNDITQAETGTVIQLSNLIMRRKWIDLGTARDTVSIALDSVEQVSMRPDVTVEALVRNIEAEVSP